jgi:hypothetical protein
VNTQRTDTLFGSKGIALAFAIAVAFGFSSAGSNDVAAAGTESPAAVSKEARTARVGHIAAEFERLANVLLGRGCGNPALITYPPRGPREEASPCCRHPSLNTPRLSRRDSFGQRLP